MEPLSFTLTQLCPQMERSEAPEQSLNGQLKEFVTSFGSDWNQRVIRHENSHFAS